MRSNEAWRAQANPADCCKASYLSGMLIGHELRGVEAKQVHILGAPALAALYSRAASLLGIGSRMLDPEAAVHALFRLGGMLRG